MKRIFPALILLSQNIIASDQNDKHTFPVCATKQLGSTIVSFSIEAVDEKSVAQVTWSEVNAISDRPFTRVFKEKWQLSPDQTKNILELDRSKKTHELWLFLHSIANPPTSVIESSLVEDFASTTW